MADARWILGLVLVAIGSLVACANTALAVAWLARRHAGSMVPVVGGACGAIGLAILPDALSRAWWIAPVVDLGCVPILIAAVVAACARTS